MSCLLTSSLLFASLLALGSSDVTELLPRHNAVSHPLVDFARNQMAAAGPPKQQPINCNADDERAFTGCLDKFLSGYGMKLINGKMPDAVFAQRAMFTTPMKCGPYKDFLKCKGTDKCLYDSIMQKHMMFPRDDDAMWTVIMEVFHISCTGTIDQKAIESAKCSESQSEVGGEFAKCKKEDFNPMPCSNSIALIKCGKSSVDKVCKGNKAVTLMTCTETAYVMKYYQMVDTKCYDQLVHECNGAAMSQTISIVMILALAITATFFN